MEDNNEKVVNVKAKVDNTEIKKAIKLLQKLEETYKKVQTLRKELDSMGDIEVNVTSET
ncbi:hypothetical protein SPD48_14440 [Pseudogracilibacillus sp. SE30717A]|uniref:hypothetical protein n=1 Tax=Pseudogracilibacillus sp. SE30717A TaxID=3098293 RepID=UPI00300E4E3B